MSEEIKKDESRDVEKNSPAKKSKKGLIIGIVAAVVVIAVLVVVIFKLLNREEIVERDEIGARGTLVTEDNLEEILDELGKPVEDGSYIVRMTTEWSFPSGSESSTNAYIANVERNKRTVYVDVFTETDELVYSSPYIPVGAELADITLDKDLPAGDYPCTCVYYLVDDEGEVLTTVSISVTLQIIN